MSVPTSEVFLTWVTLRVKRSKRWSVAVQGIENREIPAVVVVESEERLRSLRTDLYGAGIVRDFGS